ncbi:MAG: hypothetical protein QXR48_00430 [Candidatus Woesearchaeota archaeon]
MKSKKGAWIGFVLHPLFETMVAVMILITMLSYIHGVGEKTTFEKRFLATDLALIQDAIPAMPQPGNLFLIYIPQVGENFSINYLYNFSRNSVSALAKIDDPSPGLFYFTPDPGISTEESFLSFSDKKVIPVFVKQGKNLLVRNLNERNYDYYREYLTCSDEKLAGGVSVVSAHASNAEAEQVIARMASGMLGPKQGNNLLAIKLSNSSPGELIIKAFVNGDNVPEILGQSQRLGCEVVNALITEFGRMGFEVTGAAVIPVNPDQTSADDSVISKGTAGVLLEISASDQSLFVDPSHQMMIATAIMRGVSNA